MNSSNTRPPPPPGARVVCSSTTSPVPSMQCSVMLLDRAHARRDRVAQRDLQVSLEDGHRRLTLPVLLLSRGVPVRDLDLRRVFREDLAGTEHTSLRVAVEIR